jgi:hypothetical protein
MLYIYILLYPLPVCLLIHPLKFVKNRTDARLAGHAASDQPAA